MEIFEKFGKDHWALCASDFGDRDFNLCHFVRRSAVGQKRIFGTLDSAPKSGYG